MDGNTYERVKEDYSKLKSHDKQKENIITERKTYRFVKRLVDILASIIGIILLVPITIIVCILNLVTKNKGPLFFVQERVGKDGNLFKMYKYRTMVVNAEEILNRHIKEETDIGKEYVKNKKLHNDPRITKVGKFLRRTSLDEFPQFINVLKGDMSLVGPRPYLIREIKDMNDYYYYIVKDRPGLTGPWQVSGRSNIEFEERLELDYKYVINKSLKKDFIILMKTIAAVFKKEGAI